MFKGRIKQPVFLFRSLRHPMGLGLAATLALAAWLAWMVGNPVHFRTMVMIKPLPPGEGLPALPEGDALDVAPIFPQGRLSGDNNFAADPRQKYVDAFERKMGNCSNAAFGLAYYLEQKGIPYHVVHMLYPEGFLQGKGHTVVQTHFFLEGARHSGIVDISEGGIPVVEGKPVDRKELRLGTLSPIRIMPLNGTHDSISVTYAGHEPHNLGVLTGEECGRYFRFLSRVFVPLGNRKLEKFVYDGLALLLGFYPDIHVRAEAYEALFKGREPVRAVFIVLLWLARSLAVLVPCLILWRIFTTARASRSAGSAPAAARS